MAISDPGVVLIFTAFVPRFVDPARGSIPLQPAVLAGTACGAVGAGTRRAGPTRRAEARPGEATGAVLPGTAGASAVPRT
ncbi:hypothetical protein [Saccharothrix lopnurensis]|uniref:Uncharacterized protein n=1 Tax=Saccharothrix lopnurensis TaxID=1670621 RepID=A0ABW1P0Z5_9PSEU